MHKCSKLTMKLLNAIYCLYKDLWDEKWQKQSCSDKYKLEAFRHIKTAAIEKCNIQKKHNRTDIK